MHLIKALLIFTWLITMARLPDSKQKKILVKY